MMLLYKKTNEQEKCLALAKRVVAFPVKVTSPATRDIKREAEEIITVITKDKHIES